MPDGVTAYSRWFEYKNERIIYDKIRSIRIYAEVQKMTMNFVPMPDEFALHQNYPNPFNPVTQIRYDLPEKSNVTLLIFDILGREVAALLDGEQEPGYHSIMWNGQNRFGQAVGAGMYFYSIQTGQFRQTRKMILLK